MDGVRARYWDEGQGPTLLLLHPLGGFAEGWLPNLAFLAEHFRVLVLDMVGFGRSDKPDIRYDLARQVQFTRGFLTALEVERTQLVGHSIGGAIALRLAASHPALVEKLVLVSSATLGRESHLSLRLLSVPGVGELFGRPSRFGARRFASIVIRDPALITDELVELLHGFSAMPGAQRSLLSAVRANLTLGGIRPEVAAESQALFAHVKCPTLVIAGRDDALVPVHHCERAAKEIPGAVLQVFELCGHMAPYEQASAFNALVLRFLSR